jgi:hypothetical protein
MDAGAAPVARTIKRTMVARSGIAASIAVSSQASPTKFSRAAKGLNTPVGVPAEQPIPIKIFVLFCSFSAWGAISGNGRGRDGGRADSMQFIEKAHFEKGNERE